MSQYGRRDTSLTTSFYKNFIIRKEGQNGVILKKWEFLSNKGCFIPKFHQFSSFSYLDLSFDGICLKIAFVILCMNYLII